MHKTVVLNVVGLTRDLIGQHTPRLAEFAAKGRVAGVGHVLPAVTCSVQSTYLTDAWPSEHGIVGNGWYFRDECEVKFWRQSNRLVQRPKVWETARELDAKFTCANVFWWYNMYSSADIAVTPRPMYPADGRKLPDIWTHPTSLRHQLQEELGQFPLFKFWGPATSIQSTDWIAQSALSVDRLSDPTLTLIYLPHLDYCLQRTSTRASDVSKDLHEVDEVCGRLIDHYSSRGASIIILSEYGISPVSRPVHLNRVFRERGWITVREELGRELLDAGASRAFVVADHQVAHVYVNDSSILDDVRRTIAQTPGVAEVLDDAGKRAAHLDHERSGELVVVAEPDAWFTYYYWLDESRRPDFANTVDIHRKPGYDPVELFLDPKIPLVKGKIAWTLAKRKLGLRSMLNVIPTDAALVKGSHGRAPSSCEQAPVLITQQKDLLESDEIAPTSVRDVMLAHLTGRIR